MLRFIGVVGVALLMLGGVALCQWSMTRQVEFHLTREPGHGAEHEADSGPVELVLTPTFTAVDDPFALRSPDGDTPRLQVWHEDTLLLRHTTDLRAGELVRVPGLNLGRDQASIRVEATPSPEEAVHPCALRVEIFRDGVLCDDQTLWSHGGGTRVVAVLTVQLTPRLRTLDRGLGTTGR